MQTKQEKILDSVLDCIARDGWTERALFDGATLVGIRPKEVTQLFPNGVADVAEAFQARITDYMHEKIETSPEYRALRVRDKVAFGVRARIEAVTPFRDVVRGLLVWSLSPSQIKNSASQLWRAADAIWVAAGDTSTDYNRMTKRVLLMGVMKATLSFWLQDKSANYADTWAFLDRRIVNVLSVGKVIGAVKLAGVGNIVAYAREHSPLRRRA